MGLELTELLMAVEEEFGVRIDDDFVDVRTVGDVYRWVCDQVVTRPMQKCRRLGVFLKIRKALGELSGAGPRDISLDTPLETLLPKQERRKAWKTLQTKLGRSLPELRRSRSLTYLGIALCLFLIGPVVSLCISSFGVPELALGEKLFFAFVFWMILGPLTVMLFLYGKLVNVPLKRCVAPDCATPRAIVLLTTQPELTTAPPVLTEQEIWTKLVNIIAMKLGVDPAILKHDTRFAEDLEAY